MYIRNIGLLADFDSLGFRAASCLKLEETLWEEANLSLLHKVS
ncbi:protein of unknown function [Pseudodesulfovibrio piezophilus C1TLV30]|uniref:Uncharacterized protein n=1 Tax=Pseudodesulfovibrio piezophilus (strain DSM 21447 / JCM 15486 / C1TLV30) TaxID=1322246 RepID=M1WRY9_PSEP2|nr:protein of unknown function [Pseudodesulfovibrio piezophilus C1TLV30]